MWGLFVLCRLGGRNCEADPVRKRSLICACDGMQNGRFTRSSKRRGGCRAVASFAFLSLQLISVPTRELAQQRGKAQIKGNVS